MSYYIATTINDDFEAVIEKVTEELGKQGFGVLTQIDVQATMKKKLGVDFQKYRILGACNPSFAYKALTSEDKIGTMLPCNVIVQAISDETVEVAAVDPLSSMQAVPNDELPAIATEIRDRLQQVIESL